MNTSQLFKKLLQLKKELLASECYTLSDFTQTKVKKILRKNKVAGVYAISIGKPNNIVYIGRSKNLPVRIGSDHRSLTTNLAPVTVALMKELKLSSMEEARKKFLNAACVRFIEVDDVITRALLEIYIANELRTKYNSFEEH